MKKTLFGLTLVAATVLVGTATVNAAEVSKGDTEVGIGFSEDHINPGPYAEKLTLVRYPKLIDFGSGNSITSQTMEFDAVNMKQPDREKFLGVFDDRKVDEKGKGWTLSAQLSKLTEVNGSGTPAELTGKMSLNFNEPKKWNAVRTQTDWDLPNPTAQGALSAFSAEEKAEYNFAALATPVELTVDGQASTPIMSANAATQGTDIKRGGVVGQIESAKLHVTGGQKAETQYKGNIHWTLADVYGQN